VHEARSVYCVARWYMVANNKEQQCSESWIIDFLSGLLLVFMPCHNFLCWKIE